MDATEHRIVAMLSARPIVWTGLTFACPQGLSICDVLYHGEGVSFETTKEIRNIGFVLDEAQDRRIIFSILQHGSAADLSSVRYDDDYSADSGSIFLLNGPVTTEQRSESISRAIGDGLPKERLVSPSLSSEYGPTRCGDEDCFAITAGWGSGGYEVFNSPTCHILDHWHVRSDVEGGR